MSGNSKNTGQKRSSANSAEEYRRYLIRVMRTGAGGISPHDEVCQCRKQITGDVRHRSIKRVASAVGEGSIAIECINTWIDFDYHRTNDGHRGGDEPAPQGSPLCEA